MVLGPRATVVTRAGQNLCPRGADRHWTRTREECVVGARKKEAPCRRAGKVIWGLNLEEEDKEGLLEGRAGPSYTEARGEYSVKRKK